MSDKALPKWLREIFNLDDMATIKDLPLDLKVNSVAELQAVGHFFQILLTRNLNNSKIERAHCFPYSELNIDLGLVESLNLSRRTSNTIKYFLGQNGGSVAARELTFGTLSNIHAMGSKSILEFLFAIESVNVDKCLETEQPTLFSDTATVTAICLLLDQIESTVDIDKIYLGDPRFPAITTLFHLDSESSDLSLDAIIENVRQHFEVWPVKMKKDLIIHLESLINDLDFSNTISLEEHFRNFINFSYQRAKEINLLAMHERFGINTIGALTLEECGKKAGITRERIRQIEAKIYKNVKKIKGDGPIFLPGIETSLNIIRGSFGSTLPEIQKKFSRSNITSLPISVDAVLLFSSLLRYDVSDIKVETLQSGEKIVVGENFNANSVMTMLNKLYSKNGISDLNLVYDSVSEDDETISYEETKNIARGSGKWTSLDGEERWWILTNPNNIKRNRLLNVTQKICSVCNPISIDDIKSGFIKLANFRNSSSLSYSKNKIVSPSKEAILLFFANMDGFKVDGNTLTACARYDCESKLGKTEQGIIEVLQTSPSGLMSRQEIMRNCTQNGLKETSVNTYLTYSPVVQHIDLDTYKIVGKETSASGRSAHQQSLAEKSKERRLLLCDWDRGQIRFVVRCPQFTSNLVIGTPSNVKKLIIGKKFDCYDEASKEPCGTVGVNETGTMYGMNTYCRKYGIEENDILLIKLNPIEYIALLSTDTIDNYLNIIE